MPEAANERLSIDDLHKTFLNALGAAVASHGDLEKKPLEVDLTSPLPPKLRVYMYNATYPPGGRTTLTVPADASLCSLATVRILVSSCCGMPNFMWISLIPAMCK